MSRFVDIDLSGMASPPVVEQLDFETYLAEYKDDFVKRVEAKDVPYDVQGLETDPAIVVLEEAAYRETILRARVNGAARSVMLAFAQHGDLEHLAAYYGVTRAVVTPATNTAAAVMESDERLRRRVQLAPEAFTTAGSEGAYMFHALTLIPSMRDVAVMSPEPGHVHVLPLMQSAPGSPTTSDIERVRDRLSQKEIKPLTDILRVRAPVPNPYTVSAQLKVASGPDPAVVKAKALAAVQAYCESRRMIGLLVSEAGIKAALMVAGVESVLLNSPLADIQPAPDAFAYATLITLTAG